MVEKVVIDWSEHPGLRKIDEFIGIEFSQDEGRHLINDGYHRCRCVGDVKVTMRRVIEDQIELYETLLEKIEALPDDTQIEYETEV